MSLERTNKTTSKSKISIEHLLLELQFNPIDYCIFLDIDGTLSEFCTAPEKSYISAEALNIIQQILALKVHVFAITGRSANIAYQLFHPIELPIAGTHGLEMYENTKLKIQNYSSPAEFSQLKQDLQASCLHVPELLVEYKTHSVAVHYRNKPELALVAKNIMLQLQERYTSFKLSEGKFVWELLPIQADKGSAIQGFIQHYKLEKLCPIFIGDDITDESGFMLVNQRHGISIKVADGLTQAKFRLDSVTSVIRFLRLLLQSLQLKNHKKLNLRKEYQHV